MSSAKFEGEIPLARAKVPVLKRHTPDPRRVAWGRESWKKRRGLTPEGSDRIRQSTVARQPWRHSTGPRTEAGRRQSALNAKRRQTGKLSQRETTYYLGILRASLAIMDYVGPEGLVVPDQLQPGRISNDLLKFSSVFQQLIPGLAGMDVPAVELGLPSDSLDETGEATRSKGRRPAPKQRAFCAPRRVPSLDDSLQKPPATSVLRDARPLLHCLRPTHWARPPAWLWHLSGAFIEMKRKRWKKLGAPGLRPVVEFREKLQQCDSQSRRKRLMVRYPALFMAYQIASEPIDSPRRLSVEMLVLANMAAAEIAAILGLDRQVVEAYEQVFFDVRHFLDSPSFVVGQVIKLHNVDAATCRTRLLRHSAYVGGPVVARCLVRLFGEPELRLPTEAELPAMDAAVIKLMVEAKVAIELLPHDDRRVQRLMTRYLSGARNGLRKEPASLVEDQLRREATKVALSGIQAALGMPRRGSSATNPVPMQG